jgi:hypothetical protein
LPSTAQELKFAEARIMTGWNSKYSHLTPASTPRLVLSVAGRIPAAKWILVVATVSCFAGFLETIGAKAKNAINNPVTYFPFFIVLYLYNERTHRPKIKFIALLAKLFQIRIDFKVC